MNSLEPERHAVVGFEGRRFRDQHDLHRSIVIAVARGLLTCGGLFKLMEQTLSVRRVERPKQIDGSDGDVHFVPIVLRIPVCRNHP